MSDSLIVQERPVTADESTRSMRWRNYYYGRNGITIRAPRTVATEADAIARVNKVKAALDSGEYSGLGSSDGKFIPKEDYVFAMHLPELL